MAESAELMTESLVPDGGLEKTVLRKGDGEPAGKDARVSLRYSMRLQNAPVDEYFDSSSKRRNGLLEFSLGKGKVIPAIELIAESMASGEECEVVCAPPYAFGEKGLKKKGVPPNATVIIRAEMVRFEGGTPRKTFEDMSPLERYSEAVQFKERGNKLFKETKFEKAVAEYSKAIHYLSEVFSKPKASPAKKNEAALPVTHETEEADSIADKAATDPASMKTAAVEDGGGNSAAMAVTDEVAKEKIDTSACTNDEEGFQEAQIVIDATQSDGSGGYKTTSKSETVQETMVQENVGAKLSPSEETPAGPNEQSIIPTESDVLDLHVKTLNNLALCCIKMGEFSSAEKGSTIAIRMDSTNSKAFYNR